MTVALTLDVGGTKLAAAVVSTEGTLLATKRCPTPATTSAEGLFSDVADLLVAVWAEVADDVRDGGSRPEAIGAGCGGPMTRDLVSPLNIPVWQDFPLRARLEERFGLPAVVDNDAKALALGEGWVGAARGETDFLGMVVSTGVGGGIVLDGRLLHGADGNAGHVGHVIVVPDGERCACGALGCVEAEGSGTSIARKAVARLRAGSDLSTSPLRRRWDAGRGDHGGEKGSLSAVDGLTAADVSIAAQAGDPVAASVLTSAGTAIGRGIASVANLLDLRLAVVGGGVAAAGDLLFDPMREEAGRRARLRHSRSLRIVPAALGGDAGLVGAAALALGVRPAPGDQSC